MKERVRQRKNRRRKEEMLNIRNYLGVLDPTPYQAALLMRSGYFYAQKRKSRRKEAVVNE